MDLVLQGIRILEFGHFIAAPMAGMMLAEQGADVIHIVNPNETSIDPVMDAILERGKIRLEFDLNNAENINKIKEILTYTDVVIENYRPNSLKQLGLDFDTIRATINPRLIVCEMHAFPKGDPRGEMPGYEGIAGMPGTLYEKPLSPPIFHNLPIGSVVSSFFAVNAIVAALIARLRDGCGQSIEIPFLHADLFTQILQIVVLNGAPRSFMPLKMLATPFMGSWLCADQRYLYVHMTMPAHNAQILDFMAKNGYSNEINELLSKLTPATRADPTLVKDIAEANMIKLILGRIYQTKTADEWEKILGNQFCVTKIRKIEEYIKDSIDAKMPDAITINDPIFGPMQTPGPGIFSPQIIARAEPRKIAINGIEPYLKLWKENRANANKNSTKCTQAPLVGIKVLDLSRIIAGPFAGRVLAELGAEVISVQTPNNLDWAVSFHVVFNVGKKSITLDLSTEEGKKRFWALVDWFKPDVIIQNYRSYEFTKQIGLDYDTFKKHNPQIIYTYLNGFGIQGEWQSRPAFEQIVQAITGIQMGYAKKGKPKLFPMAILDFGGGLLGAFATLLGLYNKLTRQQGLFFNSRMTSMAIYILIMEMSRFQFQKCMDFAQKSHPEITNNLNVQIYSAVFKAKDQFMCIAGPRKAMEEWFSKTGLSLQSNISWEDQSVIIQKHFRKHNLRFWEQSLQTHGFKHQIGLIRRYNVRNVFKDNPLLPIEKFPFICKKEYPGLKSLTFLHAPMHFSETLIADISPAPIRGYHTKEFLEKIGIEVPDGTGVLPYAKEKPFLKWLWNFIVWGLYALKSGNM